MKAILRSGVLALAMMLAKTVTVHADAFDNLVVFDHGMEMQSCWHMREYTTMVDTNLCEEQGA